MEKVKNKRRNRKGQGGICKRANGKFERNLYILQRKSVATLRSHSLEIAKKKY